MKDIVFEVTLVIVIFILCFAGRNVSKELDTTKESLTLMAKVLEIQTKEFQIQTQKIDRYEMIIADMMQGQWTPEMGIQKNFVEDWYGTPIWSFKAVNRPPGSPAVDIGEILDRKIEGE